MEVDVEVEHFLSPRVLNEGKVEKETTGCYRLKSSGLGGASLLSKCRNIGYEGDLCLFFKMV